MVWFGMGALGPSEPHASERRGPLTGVRETPVSILGPGALEFGRGTLFEQIHRA